MNQTAKIAHENWPLTALRPVVPGATLPSYKCIGSKQSAKRATAYLFVNQNSRISARAGTTYSVAHTTFQIDLNTPRDIFDLAFVFDVHKIDVQLRNLSMMSCKGAQCRTRANC